ncbi:MAG: hypothetical protein J5651_00200 [Salinivirgaceae bacterium]|nr:hypothetical protein [Salinivirgaceae bacterium]
MAKKNKQKQLGEITAAQKNELKAQAKAAAGKVAQKGADAANRALAYLNEGDNMNKVLRVAGCVGLFLFGFLVGKRRGKMKA